MRPCWSRSATPKQIKSVTTISTSGQHLLALINDILDLSKIEAGKLELRIETLLTHDFCQGCLVFVQAQAVQKRISVACDVSPGLREFQADPKRFKQVLVNLLTNAVKFTPPDGHIGLTVVASADEAAIKFTVWDTGIGIAPADQGKVFQAFTQVDSGLNRTQEGTGLGLALVARLAELHNGSVTLVSEPGKGSRFTVTLPWQPPPAPGTFKENAKAGVWSQSSAISTAAVTAPPVTHQFHRALLIEDDPTAADQLVHYLNSLGLSSGVHPRGEEVIAAVLREQPDIILLDLLLPNEDGWRVLARLKEHPQTRAIPVAVVSVVDEPEKSIALGAAAHFIKPVSRDQLAAFLRQPRPSAPSSAPPTPLPGPTILLAEDSEANIQTIGGYLMELGYDMHYALNGLTAVKLARELCPAIILMDIQMPMMDGLSAIREIRADARLRDIPIVALTALAMPGDRERCLSGGATDYMSKPVSLKALRTLIESLLPANGEGRPSLSQAHSLP